MEHKLAIHCNDICIYWDYCNHCTYVNCNNYTVNNYNLLTLDNLLQFAITYTHPEQQRATNGLSKVGIKTFTHLTQALCKRSFVDKLGSIEACA